MKSRENFINDLGLSDSLMDANGVSTEHEGTYDEVMRSAVSQVNVKKKKNGLPHGVKKEELMNAQGNEKRITAKMQAFVSNIAQWATALQTLRTYLMMLD